MERRATSTVAFSRVSHDLAAGAAHHADRTDIGNDRFRKNAFNEIRANYGTADGASRRTFIDSTKPALKTVLTQTAFSDF